MPKKKREARLPLGCMIVDFDELTKVCAEKGFWVEDVLAKTGLSHHTIERIRTRQPVRPSSLEPLAEILAVDAKRDQDDRIRPNYLEPFAEISGRHNMARIAARQDAPTPPISVELKVEQMSEWTDEKVLTTWLPTSNGLQYRISKWRHRLLASAWARVKCYDVSHLSDMDRAALRESLVRHAEVCRRLPASPRFPMHERVFNDASGRYWWVIDRWIDGHSLADCLREPWPVPDLLRLGGEMAEGLRLLHAHSIVRRELSPRFILLRDSDRSVVFTDFELAKLLDAVPTVSNDWPEDPYRAPEVGQGPVDVRADVYSWGRIMCIAALGVLPVAGKERKALMNSNLPNGLRELLLKCVALPRSDRPVGMREVMEVVARMGNSQ